MTNSMTMHAKPSAILFDFDDTLVDARPIINKALESTFANFGISEEIIKTKNIDINRSLRDYFHYIFADNIIEARETYYKYYTEYASNITAFDQVEAVLKLLQQHKVFTAVVSNKNGPRLRSEIYDIFAWQDYFAAIVGAGDADEDKPSPLPAKLALQTSGLTDYANVWFIGDTIVDLETARNLGCKGILYGDNPKAREEGVSFYYQVKNHNELLELLQVIYA
jgi:phosphoglycolate phosphatase